LEVRLLVFSEGVIQGIKWVGKASKVAKVIEKLPRLEKLAKTVKASKAYQKVAEALSRGGKVASKSDAIKWIEHVLHDPKSVWGKGPEEIADAFRKAGHEAIVEQSKKGSKLSKQIRIKGGDINNIQVHPGGGRHGGAYYKISSSTKGVIKVVDRATPRMSRRPAKKRRSSSCLDRKDGCSRRQRRTAQRNVPDTKSARRSTRRMTDAGTATHTRSRRGDGRRGQRVGGARCEPDRGPGRGT
jgi:hypothetical protein